MRAVKHVPLRTCVICRRKTAKPDLTRIAAIPDGTVAVDDSGKRLGRGAYVCREGECIQDSHLGKGHLEFALRRVLSDADWANVVDDISAI